MRIILQSSDGDFACRHQGVESIAEEQGEDAFYPGNTKRTTALVAKSEVARGFVVHPSLLALADTYLGPACNQVQLSVCSALNIGPGARPQRLHREDGPYPAAIKQVLAGSDLVMWSMWAITEFTQENGATLVVPGSRKTATSTANMPTLCSHELCRFNVCGPVEGTSNLSDFGLDFLEGQWHVSKRQHHTHTQTYLDWRILGADKWEPEREALQHEVTYAAMPAGSVLVSRGGLLHAAGANSTSNDWRVGVFMSYTLGWLRQEENLYVDVPPELAIGFPKDVREILGCESLRRYNDSIQCVP